MSTFVMPSLGADMDEGTVLEWLVEPGDVVNKGDIVAVVDTSKSAVDVETFESGVVQQILVGVGEKVPVGTPLAEIGAETVAAVPATREPVKAGTTRKARGRKASAATPAPGADAAEAPDRLSPELLASPVVRRFARSTGVDLGTVQGSGPHGRITHDDVVQAVPPSHPAPPESVGAGAHGPGVRISPYARRRARELGVDPADLMRVSNGSAVSAADVEAAAIRGDAAPAATAVAPPDGASAAELGTPTPAERAAAMRRAIATLMSRSKREIPHYYLAETYDLAAAAAWVARYNDGRPVQERLVMAALLAKATALAARQVPQLNGFWVDDAFQAAPAVHLGVAVSLRGGGLVTPAIHDADALALPDLMAALRDVVERARRGVLHRAELTDGTLTMTNLGERGARSVLGVIFPPQVGLVGFGRVVDRPVAVDGLVGVHPTVDATLSGDHRAGDGHVGGTFLAVLGELLERPEEL